MSIRTNIRGLNGASSSPIISRTSLDLPSSSALNESRLTVGQQPQRNMSDIAAKIQRLEELLASSVAVDTTGTARRISDHMVELREVSNTLRSVFPKGLDELLLMAEEERALREELQAELQFTRLKWKTEVRKLHEILAYKSESISVLSESEGNRQSGLVEISNLEKRLHEAEAERDQLRSVIKGFK